MSHSPTSTPQTDCILGIDLGSTSLGWALIKRENGTPVGLFQPDGLPALGVRIFEAATEGSREAGSEKTRNVERRRARLQRRQLWRRARRLRNVFNVLVQNLLLPPLDATSDPNRRISNEPAVATAFRRSLAKLRPAASPQEQRQNLLNGLDEAIRASDWFKAKAASGKFGEPEQTLPYILRASALDEPLEPYFLGRALYHLAQRRGFQTNWKGSSERDENLGKVKSDISELEKKKGSLTLGQYFSTVSPTEGQDDEHIRRWHTRRDMYEEEYDKIWSRQASHYEDMFKQELRKSASDVKAELHRAIFYQREIWFDRNSIGRCSLEPGERRAPMYLLSAERFRLLDKVNNLRVLPPDKPEFVLTPEHRKKLIDTLEFKREMSFDSIRKLLEFRDDYKFNLEPLKRKKRKGEKEGGNDGQEGEKSGNATIKGNRTNTAFHEVFGERWLKMSCEERDRAVEYAYAFQSAEKLRDAAKRKWDLNDAAAEKLSKLTFETIPASLSLKGIKRVLPLLEAGKTFAEARREVYPDKFQASAPLPTLPPVEFAGDAETFQEKWLKETNALPEDAQPPEPIGEIRNPAVTRSLTELRKVVNGLLARGIKFAEVHIELLRELRQPKSARERIWEANLDNKAARDNARRQIKDELGVGYEPTQDDVRRYLLFKECAGRCAYCKETIPRKSFYGDNADIHIDHIIPRCLLPDNTYANLILCHSHCNAEKADRTPYQAFSEDRLAEIKARVKLFQGRAKWKKLRRVSMNNEALKEFVDKFTERQLRDSAYASKVASKYLGYLFGGVYDAEGRQRIMCTSGEITADLRKAWGLFSVLDDGPTDNGGAKKKGRKDHRHHAVDAVAVALTTHRSVEEINEANKRLPPGSRRRSPPIQLPWMDFVDSIRAEVDRIVVSHRVSKKVSGALHKETNYSPDEFGRGVRRHRVPLTKLTEKDVRSEVVIADPGVRRKVQEKLAGLGGGSPKDVFKEPRNLPIFSTANGRNIPIKKVRIQETVKARQVGEGYRARFVKPGKNHHLEVFARVDPKNPEIERAWDSKGPTTMLDAFQCLHDKKPVFKTNGFGDGTRYKFSLAAGEVLECDLQRNGERLLSDSVKLTTEEKASGRVRLVVRGISQEEERKGRKKGSIKVEMVHINDARPNIEFPDHVTKSPGELFKWKARKIIVSPLGEVITANEVIKAG